jgi:hypothetical protein
MHLGPISLALCAPSPFLGEPYGLTKFQMAPKLVLRLSSGSKKKEPRCICLSEAKASHSQRMWAEVSSAPPHFLHNGLSISPKMCRCLLRVLCPVRRPITALSQPVKCRRECNCTAEKLKCLDQMLTVLTISHSCTFDRMKLNP